MSKPNLTLQRYTEDATRTTGRILIDCDSWVATIEPPPGPNRAPAGAYDMRPCHLDTGPDTSVHTYELWSGDYCLGVILVGTGVPPAGTVYIPEHSRISFAGQPHPIEAGFVPLLRVAPMGATLTIVDVPAVPAIVDVQQS